MAIALRPVLKPNSGKHTVQVRVGGTIQTYETDQNKVTIGRDENSDVRVHHSDVSSKHLVVRFAGQHVFINDLGSTNGTFVSGRRVTPNKELLLASPDTLITLGKVAVLSFTPASTVKAPAVQEPESVEIPVPESASHPGPVEEVAPTVDEVREAALAEIAAFKKKAIREIESIQLEAVKSSEKITDESRRDAEKLKAEAILAGEKTAKDLKTQAEAEAAATRNQAQLEADNLVRKTRQEADAISNELASKRAEAEKLQAQINSLIQETEKAKAAHLQESNGLKELRHTAEDAARDIKREREKLDSQLDDAKTLLETTRQQESKLSAQVVESTTKKTSLLEELSRLETQLTETTRSSLRAKEETTLSLQEKSQVQNSLADLKIQLSDLKDSLRAIQLETQRERETQQVEERRRKALYDALDAELKTKQMAGEIQVGQSELRKLELEREILQLKAQAEDQLAKSKLALAEVEKQAIVARERREHLKDEADSIQASKREAEAGLALLEKSTIIAKNDSARTQADLLRSQSELSEARAQFLVETQKQKSLLEQEARIAREQLDSELSQYKKTAQDEVKKESDRQRESLRQDFVEGGKAMERELADAKLKELKIIEQMQSNEKTALLQRFEATLEDIVSKTLHLAQQRPLDQSTHELRKLVRAALEGKISATLSLEASSRSRIYWKKMAIRAAVPAGVILFFALFPGIPGYFRERFMKTVASEKNDSGVFLEQIKQRGMKFQPDTDTNFRATYTDNILYLDQYVEMKLEDKTQKDWTLILNDFIVGRLGLSDRVIPDFISAEAVMVQDLLHIREGILPQFKDQGLARMAEVEKTGSDKLIQMLGGVENYQKFRLFEHDYYDDYIKKRKPSPHST